MKNKKIAVAVVVLLIAAVIGYYIYDIAVNKTPYTENLIRVVILVVSGIISLARVLLKDGGRKPLSFYEKSYPEELSGVFTRDEKSRKQLLEAVRFYNESNYKKAISLLDNLKKQRPAKRDLSTVYLFSALCYTDWGLPNEAIKEYDLLLQTDPENSTALSNLGHIYANQGDYENAESCYIDAIDVNPNNHFAHNNLAQLYFRMRDFESAVESSLTALEICPNFRQSATLLAIIYGALDDEENYAKYRLLAVQCGEDAQAIYQIASDLRMSLKQETQEAEETEETEETE